MKTKIYSTNDPYGFKGAARESKLTQLSRLGRKLGLIASDLDECLDELEAFQDSGYSNYVVNFSDEELNILGQASEILMQACHQITNV